MMEKLEKYYGHIKPYIGSTPPTIYEAGGEQFIMIPATGSWS